MQPEQPTKLATALEQPGVWWAVSGLILGTQQPVKLEVVGSAGILGEKAVTVKIGDTEQILVPTDDYINDWIAYRNYWFAWAAAQRG